ncbi:MAG TPA: polysaccharide biosynthesis/export family protein [bacterium]|nr:polysaccharide biosynthesis/export family protein [bacterium]
MDVKCKLILFLILGLFFSSCTYSKARKFKDVPESEFDVEDMNLNENFKEISVGENTYIIGVGDEIKISIYRNPQDSSQATAMGEVFGNAVDENGEINVPLVKYVKIAGLSRHEATEKLEKLYEQYIKEPHIMLDVVKFESKFYYVTGNVKNAGKHPIKINTNFLEAVTEMVPSTTENHSVEFVYLKRGETVLPISVSDVATGAVDYSKYYLSDGDIFYVPAPSANRAYILGEVKRPGAYEINTGKYTLLDLVADAGGLTPPYSSEGRIYLVRQSGNKHLLVKVHFDEIFSGKAGSLRLMPGDRVYVSPTVLTSYNRIIQQLLPTFQLLNSATSTYKAWKTMP